MNEYAEGVLIVKKVFDKHKIDFWLEGGTLLGAVREGKIIEWDDDADVSLWLHNVIKMLDTQKDFQELGYELYIVQGHYGLRNKITKKHIVCIFFNKKISGYVVKLHFYRGLKHLIWMLSEPDYTTLDYNNFDYDTQFIPFKVRKVLVTLSCKMDDVKRRKLIKFIWKLIIKFNLHFDELVRAPAKCIEKYGTAKFHDKEFSIPYDFNGYLTFMFGKDWRIPDKEGRPNYTKLKEADSNEN